MAPALQTGLFLLRSWGWKILPGGRKAFPGGRNLFPGGCGKSFRGVRKELPPSLRLKPKMKPKKETLSASAPVFLLIGLSRLNFSLTPCKPV